MMIDLSQSFYYLDNHKEFQKFSSKLSKLITEKTIVFVTNPSLKVKVVKKILHVGTEEIPLNKTVGVVFVLPQTKKEPEKFLLKGIPNVVFTKRGFALNLKTVKFEEGRLQEAYRRVCTFIGQDLQSFFRKYLTRKGAGITVRYKGRYGQYFTRESRYFIPFYNDCFSKPLPVTKAMIEHYLKDAFNTDVSLAVLGVMLLFSKALGVKIPKLSFEDLRRLYAAPIYYFFTSNYIKAYTYGVTKLEEMPLRGQIYTLTNQLTEDVNFLTTVVYNALVIQKSLK